MTDRELILRYFWLYDTLPSHERFESLGGTINHSNYGRFLTRLGFDIAPKGEDGPSKAYTYAAFKNGRVLTALGGINHVSDLTGTPSNYIPRLARTGSPSHQQYTFKKIDVDKTCHLLFREDFWELFKDLKDM